MIARTPDRMLTDLEGWYIRAHRPSCHEKLFMSVRAIAWHLAGWMVIAAMLVLTWGCLIGMFRLIAWFWGMV